ncbi:hypothetical protein OB920_09140 [Halobacteria archaeon HArc-gm2]|nr:hypothetical protein [Halobacteria archaeon HArc-gm2]
MNARLFAVCGIAALLVVGAGGAVASGFGSGPGPGFGPDNAPGSGADPGETPASPPDNGGGDDGTETTTDEPAFTVVADNTEECGRTCRDVTSTVTNRQNATAEDVTVSTQIYAGKEGNGKQVWQGSADVGTLAGGESHSETKRITLGWSDAIAVKGAGGWVTIETTVESDDETVTITERRDVA